MSFMRTLATVAVGFAAAKGVEKYRQMGGMAGLQSLMQQSGGAGLGGAMGDGVAQMSKMMDQMGLGAMMPGGTAGASAGSNPLEQLFGAFGGGAQSAGAPSAGAAGLGGLMAAMTGAAQAGGQRVDDMMGAMTGAAPATQMMEDNAKLMLRAMIQAAKADGEIDPEERAKIMEMLGDVSPEERAFVERELDAPVDVVGLAQDTSEQMRAQVYATSLMAIQVDNQRERAYLDSLAKSLGLPADMQAQMHKAMGVPLS
ncbi:MAG: DUF533 domain-containing protein [Pseudomonadota bacterium]